MNLLAIVAMWTKQFIVRSLHIKFEFNWPNDFWENYYLIYWWDSNMTSLIEKSEVNFDLWNLFIAIVTLD